MNAEQVELFRNIWLEAQRKAKLARLEAQRKERAALKAGEDYCDAITAEREEWINARTNS